MLAIAVFYIAHGYIDGLQPEEVTKIISSEVENLSEQKGVKVEKVIYFNSDDSFFGSGRSNVVPENESVFVEKAKDNNVTILRHTIDTYFSITKQYYFAVGNTDYKWYTDCYPEEESRIGYAVSSTADWPEIHFKTLWITKFLLNLLVIVIIMIIIFLRFFAYY